MISTTKKNRSLGSISVEYSLVMAITVTIVVAAAQAMNPNMESFFEAAATKIESFLGGGSSGTQGSPEQDIATYSSDANAEARQAAAQLRQEAARGGEDSGGGGFWSGVWEGTKQVGGFFKGVGEQAWDTVYGLGTLAYDIHRLASPSAILYEFIDPEGQAELRNKYVQAGQAIWNNPGDVAYAIVEPIVTDWKNGNYGEAIGRGTFEAVTIVFTPTKLGKVGKVGDVVEDVAGAANAIDNVATKADEIADAGSVAGRVDGALPDEALPNDPPYNPRETRDVLEERYGPDNVESTTVPNANGKNVELAGQRHPETGIVFDQRGFPIFDDAAKYDTRLPADEFAAASYRGQMRMATRELREGIDSGRIPASQFTDAQLRAIRGGKDKIPGYTWHHHQDTGRMQLVPEDIHRRTGHIGGESMAQGN